MPISKIFHDHIVMSNVDKHGVKQVLYPRTTSDDVLMSDGSTNLTTFVRSVILDDGSVNMKQGLKFMEAQASNARPGIVMVDNGGNEFVALAHNKTNLWIGAQSGTAVSHIGATFISTGWKPAQGSDPDYTEAYSSIKISVPKIVDGIRGNDTYDVLHTGNIGDNSITFTNYSRGIFLHDTKRNYAGVYNNGDNLWIGAASGTSYHHLGKTYISAGFKPGDDYGYTEKTIDGYTYAVGNNTIYVSVPCTKSVNWMSDPDEPYPTDDSDFIIKNYGVFHEGVVMDYLDKDNTDLSNRYLGNHLAGHLAGTMLDSVILHKTPVKDTAAISANSPVDLTENAVADDDINGADKYGRIKAEVNSNFSSVNDSVNFSFNYNTALYKYDIFTIRLYGIRYDELDSWNNRIDVTLTDNNNNTKNQFLYCKNYEDPLADYLEFDLMSLVGEGAVPDSDLIPVTGKYIKHVEVSFELSDSISVNRRFYIQVLVGNSVKGISHLHSYNEMLVDILARLYKLENPST